MLSGQTQARWRLRYEISSGYTESLMLMYAEAETVEMSQSQCVMAALLSSLNTHRSKSDSWFETSELKLTDVKILAKFINISWTDASRCEIRNSKKDIEEEIFDDLMILNLDQRCYPWMVN